MVKRWLKRASEPSRAKQGTQTPGKILQHSTGPSNVNAAFSRACAGMHYRAAV
jgi:hypothetical protein